MVRGAPSAATPCKCASAPETLLGPARFARGKCARVGVFPMGGVIFGAPMIAAGVGVALEELRELWHSASFDVPSLAPTLAAAGSAGDGMGITRGEMPGETM